VYKAKQEGKFDENEAPEQPAEEKMAFFFQEEDTDLETPVDPTAYESLKVTRNRLKEQNALWMANFRRAH
jgi:hypothetical protein